MQQTVRAKEMREYDEDWEMLIYQPYNLFVPLARRGVGWIGVHDWFRLSVDCHNVSSCQYGGRWMSTAHV